MLNRLMIVFMLAMAALSAHQAIAAPQNDPKPLTADTPSVNEKPKQDPNAFPQEFIDMRRQVKADYNSWYAYDGQVQKDCKAARTPADRAACDTKKRISQQQLDQVHAKTRLMQYRIEAWRRKQQGLPPPDWSPIESPNAGKKESDVYTATPSSPPTKNGNSVLLPSNNAPLPANTF